MKLIKAVYQSVLKSDTYADAYFIIDVIKEKSGQNRIRLTLSGDNRVWESLTYPAFFSSMEKAFAARMILLKTALKRIGHEEKINTYKE